MKQMPQYSKMNKHIPETVNNHLCQKNLEGLTGFKKKAAQIAEKMILNEIYSFLLGRAGKQGNSMDMILNVT